MTSAAAVIFSWRSVGQECRNKAQCAVGTTNTPFLMEVSRLYHQKQMDRAYLQYIKLHHIDVLIQ